MLYEGGFRIGELGNLRWRQVKFTEWNVTVNVDDKTGKPRFIPLIISRSYLSQWRNDYSIERNENGFVFITSRKEQLQYQGVAKQLRIIAKGANIDKKITPHIFRHSRITHLIQQGYNESVIKLMMWGNLSTGMFQTYAHHTSVDVEREVAAKAGIVTPTKKRGPSLEPRQCQRCYTINGPTHKFCAQCGLSLTGEVVDNLRVAHEQAELQPEYKALLDKFRIELEAVQTRKMSDVSAF
jgi:integrase/recombinase XerD